MKKLNYKGFTNQQLIDIRNQHDYQTGHIKNSLNLIPSNFKKYASNYIDKNIPVIFIVGSQEDGLDEVLEIARQLNITKIEGYLLIDDVPNEKLQSLDTISAKDFLNKLEDFILLDVRHPNEITRPAPDKNLINIPFEDLINDYESLDRDKPIFTLCGSGNRSTAAASFLKSKRFSAVVIESGMKAIQEVDPI